MNTRIFRGLNHTGDETRVDADSFRFHGPMKALFYKILSFINPPPKEWVDDIDGNIGVLRDIYREYEGHEKQGWRRDVLSKVFPFSLCLAHYDPNYEEVIQWFLFRIIQEQDRFKFSPDQKHPEFWFQDGRGRIALSEENKKLLKELGYGE